MRYLLLLDAALCALAATLALVLGVVGVLYSFHTGLSARVAVELPQVAALSLCFALLAAVLGLAFWSLLRARAWHWWAQAGAVASLVIGSMFIYRLLVA